MMSSIFDCSTDPRLREYIRRVNALATDHDRLRFLAFESKRWVDLTVRDDDWIIVDWLACASYNVELRLLRSLGCDN